MDANSTPTLKDLAIGVPAIGEREEFDSMGKVKVPADRYWGAQTQRSLQHFSIGDDRMPKAVYHAYGYVKKACALVNAAAGRLPDVEEGRRSSKPRTKTIAGKLDDNYPLYVWQTGSGTQSNMNVNEVISNRAIQLLGGELDRSIRSAPTTTSTWASRPTTASRPRCTSPPCTRSTTRLVPEVGRLCETIERKAKSWMDVVKIGRTHLEDAVPLTVGQEWYGWAGQIRAAIADIEASRAGLYELALGGTAVGTGLNAPPGFSRDVAAKIAELTGKPFVTAPNKFIAQGLARRHGARARRPARRWRSR